MENRVLITQEVHKMWGKMWVSTVATDALEVVGPAIVTKNGSQLTAKDRATVKAILLERIKTA